jgi:hypothetical protein
MFIERFVAYLTSSTETGVDTPPPPPDELYSKNEEDGHIMGLREKGKIYIDFLKSFAKAVYGRTYDDVSSTNTLSTVLTPCLEAFLLLAYENGYHVWKHEAERRVAKQCQNPKNVSDDELSASSSSQGGLAYERVEQPVHKFTCNAMSARRGEGWSVEAYDLYDELFEAIEKQRSNKDIGPTFDQEYLLNAGRSAPPSTGGRRIQRNNWANRSEFHRVAAQQLAEI